MILHTFTTADDLRPLSDLRAARRARIAALMLATAKASEDGLPPDEQRQCIDLTAEAEAVAQAMTPPPRPTWPRVAAVLVIGLPCAVLAAYALAHSLGRLADAAGAYLAR